MGWEGRRTVETKMIGKGDKKAESQRVIGTEEITSTEFPEGEDTTFTKDPRHPNGGTLIIKI